MKRDGLYEVDTWGDLMLHAAARRMQKILLIFETVQRPTNLSPISIVTPADLGLEPSSQVN